jgi:hypothetical protein
VWSADAEAVLVGAGALSAGGGAVTAGAATSIAGAGASIIGAASDGAVWGAAPARRPREVERGSAAGAGIDTRAVARGAAGRLAASGRGGVRPRSASSARRSGPAR